VAIDALNLTAGQKYYWQGEYIGGLSGIRARNQGGEFSIPQHQPLTDITKTFSSVTVITPDAQTKFGDLTGRDKALEMARGTVVNSEIIQRLGTYFPHAGGVYRDAEGKVLRGDLQMTTLDLYDYKTLGDYFDPDVQVWDNVTFADNYYQTTSIDRYRGVALGNTIPDGWLPDGSPTLSKADLNVDLSNRSGFALESLSSGKDPHNNVLAWYAGTADLSLDGKSSAFGSPILRRQGDFSQDTLYDGNTFAPWYTNDLKNVIDPVSGISTVLRPVSLGDADAQWEGVGTGWYYSAIGGGYSRRSQIPNVTQTPRTPIGVDNTQTREQRGDFAVPTLFDGNFDAVKTRKATDPIPGWVFEGLTNAGQDRLVDWNSIPTLDSPQVIGYATDGTELYDDASYLAKLDNPATINYALKLQTGEKVTHSQFVVPESGVLRFDLHVPDIYRQLIPITGSPKLRVFIDGIEPGATEYELSSRTIIKGRRRNDSRESERLTGIEIGFNYSPRRPYFQDNRIDYGNAGFETFTLDIPDELRGKAATLRFELEDGSQPVYLDNVFFGSQHEQFGNPTNAQISFNPNLSETGNDNNNTVNQNNYLIERPQYAMSYNNTTKTPNWVSWQLNNTWFGALDRDETGNRFEEDKILPDAWNKVQGSGDINGNPALDGETYDRGHVTPSGDRRRTIKDDYTTFLMSNIIPQNARNNQNTRWWNGLEEFSRTTLVKNNRKELSLIAGGYGTKTTINTPNLNSFPITVPDRVWKVVLVLDHPGEGLADATPNTMAFAVDMPNIDPATDTVVNPQDWRDYIISVRELENRLNASGNNASGTPFNFLSNLSQTLQDAIEMRSRTAIRAWVNGFLPTAPLMAAEPSSLLQTISTNTTVGHNSFIENDTPSTNIEVKHFSSIKVNIGEFSIFGSTLFQLGSSENSSSDHRFKDTRLEENSFSKISTLKINSFAGTFPEISLSEIGKAHITAQDGGITENCTSKVNISKNTTTQFLSGESALTHVGFREIGSFNNKVTPTNFSATELQSRQVESTKVSLPSIVSIQQLDSSNLSHTNTSLLTSIYSTAQSIWHTTTPIDLAFKIQDLPTGQLAEGTITSYNTNGTPKTATITIDNDANGVGWYIDQTPGDNSEFSTQLTNTAYQAVTGEAVGIAIAMSIRTQALKYAPSRHVNNQTH
jgi:large repetitive protein